MNIYVYNCSNTLNYGSMMMGENFIKYFNQISDQENKYFIETKSEINVDRLKIATEKNEIYAVDMDCLFKIGLSKYDILFSYFKFKNVISEFAKKIDMIIVLGGDDFTEDYGWKSPVVNAIKLNLLKKESLKVIMLGQTMGPYQSFRKPIMKNLLNKIDQIYPRDPITYAYLKNCKLKNINIMDDLALLPLTKQEYKERTKEYITYCPSELIYRYSKDGKREDWINFNLFMIEELMEKYPDKKLVLLAHVLKPDHVDDRKIVSELYTIIKDKYKGRIIIENKELLPYEVRNYIQQSLFVISSRMHPVVSSIQCEIPAIALSYSSKYWGIIGERYDLSDYIIDIRYLNYEEMKKKFIGLVEKIEDEYEQIQEKMKFKNILANECIMNTLEEIKSLS